MKDVSVRLTPLTDAEAERTQPSLASLPLLEGYRGSPSVDMASLRRLLVRVSALAEDLPEAAELDINPVVATPTGVIAVDARLRVEARDPRPPEGSLPRVRR